MDHRSIVDLYLANVTKYGDKTAALVKRGGAYQDVTWRQLEDDVRAIAGGIVALGVQFGDRVAVLSETRLEWVTADLGILSAGAVTVPIYPSNLPDECQYILEHSGATAVFVENEAQAAKIRAERARLPNVKRVVQLSGVVSGDDWLISLAALRDLGVSSRRDVDARRSMLDRDSALTVIYTSGTTGRPKGVVTTHDNMLYEAECLVHLDVVRPDDVQLLFLPLAHSFAKVLEIVWFATHHILAFAEDASTVRDNLREVRPTLMCGVPRVFEKFHAAVVAQGTAAGGLRARLFREAAAISERHGRAELQGRRLSSADRLRYELARRVVFPKVAKGLGAALGGRMRIMVSGGAPLSRQVAWFMRDAGLLVLEGYGLTETSAATTVNRPGTNRIGTVGEPLPGTEVRIAEDGEILVRGRGVMVGYWADAVATAEVLREGWLHTGDIGVVDRDGYLRITDRKKDLIVTAGGKNVAPQNLEGLIKSHELFSQAVVHGDRRKFLSALLTLDPEVLRRIATERQLGESASYAELSQRPEVLRLVDEAMAELNLRLPQHERIKRYKVLPSDFTQESGELTPTLKIKRRVIQERYRAILDSFYDESYD